MKITSSLNFLAFSYLSGSEESKSKDTSRALIGKLKVATYVLSMGIFPLIAYVVILLTNPYDIAKGYNILKQLEDRVSSNIILQLELGMVLKIRLELYEEKQFLIDNRHKISEACKLLFDNIDQGEVIQEKKVKLTKSETLDNLKKLDTSFFTKINKDDPALAKRLLISRIEYVIHQAPVHSQKMRSCYQLVHAIQKEIEFGYDQIKALCYNFKKLSPPVQNLLRRKANLILQED